MSTKNSDIFLNSNGPVEFASGFCLLFSFHLTYLNTRLELWRARKENTDDTDSLEFSFLFHKQRVFCRIIGLASCPGSVSFAGSLLGTSAWVRAGALMLILKKDFLSNPPPQKKVENENPRFRFPELFIQKPKRAARPCDGAPYVARRRRRPQAAGGCPPQKLGCNFPLHVVNGAHLYRTVTVRDRERKRLSPGASLPPAPCCAAPQL